MYSLLASLGVVNVPILASLGVVNVPILASQRGITGGI